jgi:hypothetical protein
MFRVGPRLSFIEPQLATSVDEPPEGDHWIHEINGIELRLSFLKVALQKLLMNPDKFSAPAFLES